ncbi:hypothetical protein M5689_006081 [Euphorbia peplus]|nr:hypothetical protein M5689_006081 [Euphorbia peplus]
MSATMAAHLTATIFLLPVGIRRLFSSSSLFLNNTSNFRSKTWYLSDPKWKNLDLYILTIALPIASLSHIFLFFSLSSHPSYRFTFLIQSLLIFLYWVLTILFLFRDTIDPLTINDSFLFLCAGIMFLLEYSIIGKGVSGIVGIAVYDLCGDLTILCGGCCLVLAVRPSAFFLEFCLCSGLVFRGTWFLQTGLSLYTDVFGFKGCRKIVVSVGNENSEVKCDLDEDGFRGVALVNLLFIGHAIGVLLLSFGVFALSSNGRKSRGVETGGTLLEGLQSDANAMRRAPEFELE